MTNEDKEHLDEIEKLIKSIYRRIIRDGRGFGHRGFDKKNLENKEQAEKVLEIFKAWRKRQEEILL